MTEAEIESHATRFSKMYQSDKKNHTSISKWSDTLARPKMALKTVLKGLLGTYGLLSPDLIKAFEADDTEAEAPAKGGRNIPDAEIIDQGEKAPEKMPTKKVRI
jgi:recombination protein RecT